MPDLADIPPPPRRLRRCRGYAMLAVYAVMLLIVGMFGQVFWQVGIGTIRLLWFCETAQATIAKITVTPRERGPAHEFDLAYRVDGTEYTHCVYVSAADAEMHKEGDVVEVQFLPERPDAAQIRIENYPVTLVTLFCGALALMPLLVFSRLVWELLVAPWRVRRLMRTGSIAIGVIVERKETTGKGARLKLIYEYEVPAPDTGEIPRGSVPVRAVMKMPGTDFVGTQVGDTVTVIYDPDRPRRSLLYEYADYEFAPAAVLA